MPVNSDWCPESNHGLGFYLYYVCCVFDICQGHSVEEQPTLALKIWIWDDEASRAVWSFRERHLSFFYSIRFSNSEATWLSWSAHWILRFEGQDASSNHAEANFGFPSSKLNFLHIFYILIFFIFILITFTFYLCIIKSSKKYFSFYSGFIKSLFNLIN